MHLMRFIFSLLVLLSYDQKTLTKSDHVKTYKMDDDSSLFVERYRIAGYGVYGGNIESVFLTDSMTFRIHIGAVDDNHELVFKMIGDLIYYKKIELEKSYGQVFIPKRLRRQGTYKVSDLRQAGKFE